MRFSKSLILIFTMLLIVNTNALAVILNDGVISTDKLNELMVKDSGFIIHVRRMEADSNILKANISLRGKFTNVTSMAVTIVYDKKKIDLLDPQDLDNILEKNTDGHDISFAEKITDFHAEGWDNRNSRQRIGQDSSFVTFGFTRQSISVAPRTFTSENLCNVYFRLKDGLEVDNSNLSEFLWIPNTTGPEFSNITMFADGEAIELRTYSDKAQNTTSKIRTLSFNTILADVEEISTDVVQGIEITYPNWKVFDDDTIYMLVDEQLELSARISPIAASNREFVWSAEGSVTVDQMGKVSANKVGEGIISVVTSQGNKTDFVKIIVQDNAVPLSSIKIVSDKNSLNEGEVIQLRATTLPENATNKKLLWSVSNENAIINENTGLLKAVKEGEVIIVAKSLDGTVSAEYVMIIFPSAKIYDEVKSMSLFVSETLYANSSKWKSSKYNVKISAFNISHMLISDERWKEYYTLEITDNFAEKKATGISRDNNIIIVDADAEDIMGLQVYAVLKNKSDGRQVLTAESNLFNVCGNLKINNITIEGGEILNSSDENAENSSDTLQLIEDNIVISVEGNHSVFLSYQINGQEIIKTNNKVIIESSELKQNDNVITIYIYGDGRSGAAGYSLNSFIKQIQLRVLK